MLQALNAKALNKESNTGHGYIIHLIFLHSYTILVPRRPLTYIKKTGLDSRNGTKQHRIASIEKALHGEDMGRPIQGISTVHFFSIRIQR